MRSVSGKCRDFWRILSENKMIRNQIKRFQFSIGGRSAECELPATVCSLSLENRADGALSGSCLIEARVQLSTAELKSKYTYLKLDGVYANAEVIFNGKSYGLLSSVERVYYFDVTDGLIEGDNRLSIVCTSPLLPRERVTSDPSVSGEYELPTFVSDMGIVGGVELLSTDSALISDVRVNQLHEGGKVTLLVDVDTLGDTSDVRHALTVVSPDGKIYFGGISNGRGLVNIPDPSLWYPKGLGNPVLYKLSVTLYHGSEAADTYEKKIGLRKIELRSGGSGAPTVTVNGSALFSLGATYVTERAIVANITRAGTEALVKNAADAGMNTLAVYSYTLSPSEYFYELCDRYGILVWQDLPIPYVAVNVAGAFAAGLAESVKSMILRAASHTSVALMYLTVTHGAGAVSPSIDGIGEFRSVCKRILEPILQRYAPTLPFLFDPKPLYERDERFLSKRNGGFAPSVLASMPDPVTLTEIAVEDTNILSAAVEDTVRTEGAVQSMLESVASSLKFPYGKDELSYAASYAPACDTVKSIKRARLDPMSTMSAVFRQLNDSEALITSSFIDAGGRKKALIYMAEEAFEPVMVSADAIGYKMRIGISNNTKKQYSGRLNYAIYDTGGKCHFETTRTVDLAPTSAYVPIEDDFERIVSAEPEIYYLTYTLSDHQGVRASGCELFSKPKRFSFPDPVISAELSGSGRRFTVKLTAKKIAGAVRVVFEGIDASADKNFISVIPGTPVMLTFDTKEVKTSLEMKEQMRVISIYNIGGY